VGRVEAEAADMSIRADLAGATARIKLMAGLRAGRCLLLDLRLVG
jgi:hypothetical protein